MVIFGITGGIATGKSTVTKLFAACGAPTVSADAIAHDLLGPGTETNRAIRAHFRLGGSDADAIDRSVLGQIVFADPAARRQLEALTHPQIIATLKAQIAAWRPLPEPRAGVAEIPLLFEAGLETIVDKIVVVSCSEEVQLARLRERLGGDTQMAREMLAAQWPLFKKVAHADYVIMSDGSLEDTQAQVSALWATPA